MQFCRNAALVAIALLTASTAFAQAAATSLTLGESVDGELTIDDAISPERDAHEDRWLFVGEAGQSIDVQLSSEEIDTYLYLYDPEGAMVASDDDSLGNLDSRIRYTLPDSGMYTIAATTFSSRAIGPYSLRIREDIRYPLNVVTLDGDQASGTLTDEDAEHSWRGYVEAVDVDAEAGETLIITVHSSSFDTYGWLLSPTHELITEADDSGGNTDAVLVHRSTMTGTYRVLVGAYGAGTTGDWTVTVDRAAGGVADPSPIDSGDVVEGALEPRDAAYRDGRFADVYTIDLDAGERLTVEHRSDVFDAWLSIEDPGGAEIVFDDDSAGNLNSAASIVATEDGAYRIVATSLGTAMGAYTMTAVVSDVPEVDSDRLRLGESVESTLDTDDPPRAVGAGFIETYTFEGDAGQSIVIEADTWSVDVLVTAPTGEPVFGNGDAGVYYNDPYIYEEPHYDHYINDGILGGDERLASTQRRFEATLHVSGTWTISVRSAQLAPVSYTMTIDAAQDEDIETTAIELGAEVSGELTPDDAVNRDRGAWMDVYELTIDEAGLYEIAMRSDDVDGYLEIAGDSVFAYNDDSDGFNPRIRTRLFPGTYTVTATSYSQAQGTYTLTTGRMEDVAPTIEPLAVGDVVEATIQPGAPVSALRGAEAHWYRLELTAGQMVSVEMNSEAFDTYLILVNALGEQVASDDDSAGNLDSLITYTAPTAGTYTVVATSYGGGVSGDFTLSISGE